MSELAKATLTELDASNALVGDAVAVQFNPASLRMQLSNRTTGGAQAGAPTRQRAGEGAVTLSFDLQFDTADEGSADAPVSVLRKTAAVSRFVRPRGTDPGEEAPPRVQFEWNAVKLQGVMESLSLELDLFAFDGTPLRARCSVSMKGQDSAYQYAPSNAGAGAGQGLGSAGLPGLPGAPALPGAGSLPTPPGGKPGAVLDAVARALDGESLAQLAVRVGLDPKAWREIGSSAPDPQRLAAGQEVALPQRSGGAGAAAARGGGTQAGALGGPGGGTGGASSAATGGASAVGGPTVPIAAASDAAGAAALTQAGGVGAAQTRARRDAHEGQAARTLAGFGRAAAAAPSGVRASASASASGSAVRQPYAVPDDRPFGFGLPLKPRRGVAAAATASATAGASTAARPRLRSTCGCGCGGRCGGR